MLVLEFESSATKPALRSTILKARPVGASLLVHNKWRCTPNMAALSPNWPAATISAAAKPLTQGCLKEAGGYADIDVVALRKAQVCWRIAGRFQALPMRWHLPSALPLSPFTILKAIYCPCWQTTSLNFHLLLCWCRADIRTYGCTRYWRLHPVG